MIVSDQQTVLQIAREIRSLHPGEYVAVDTETTGLHVYQDDVCRGMSLTYDLGGQGDLIDWYVNVSHSDLPAVNITPIVEALNVTLATQVYHHAEFDWAVLRKTCPAFEIPAGRFWDTQTIDWMMDENWSHRLKDAAERAFGTEAKDKQRELKAAMRGRPIGELYAELRAGDDPRWIGRGTATAAREEARRLHEASVYTWATITAELTAPYAMMDTNLTYRLAEWQRELIESNMAGLDISPDIEREFAFQVVLYEMMRTGIKVNPLAAENLRRDALAKLDELRGYFEGINLGSPQQLQKLLYEEWGVPVTRRTKKGAPSTDRDALEELLGEHPSVEILLEYRALSKAVGTYYNGLLDKRDPHDRIHSAFAMNRTVTGRLASSDPNLQNIPRADTSAEVRSVFVPEPGLELWEYDLAQAEMRVMAGWAGEHNMIDAIEAGRNLHAETAIAIWGAEWGDISLDEVKKQHGREYTLAKNVGYGYPYGIQAKKIAWYLVKGTGRAITRTEIAEGGRIHAQYKATYPDLARLMGGLQRQADKLGYIPLHVPGRFRRYKGAGYRNTKTYTALNSVVQGAIGEFMKDVMLAVWPEQGTHSYFRVCLQIHDSLVCEVLPGMGPQLQVLLQSIADNINPFPMRMLWDAKQWGTE
ncbi:MAG TPA: DNA polymerase [Verrucomicrobiae bacterium]|nr:DNA polymerase [Verrucomicrobiae bacterium]